MPFKILVIDDHINDRLHTISPAEAAAERGL